MPSAVLPLAAWPFQIAEGDCEKQPSSLPISPRTRARCPVDVEVPLQLLLVEDTGVLMASSAANAPSS